MHRALLIDEILQLIFAECAAFPHPESRRTLCQLARCCKAWKDVALDRLWSRIDGSAPLLGLLTCTDHEKMRVSQLPPHFLTYAGRVKEISHHSVPETPALDYPMMLMPRLESVTLSFQGCMVPDAWLLSPCLKRINVNIGFSYDPQETVDRSNAVAAHLERVRHYGSPLQTLQVRGRMTKSLNEGVAALTQLRSLTIYANCCLSCETLAAVATFPGLRSLNIHASSIHHADFAAALSRASGPCFPVLEELEIRTDGALLMVILERLPSETLTRLRAEVTRSSRGPGYLKGVFELLAQKASKSLRELTLEDQTEFEDLDLSLRPCASAEWYPISLLSPLAALKELRRFALVSMLPPALSDADMGQLGKWWPSLEHLDLGTLDVDYIPVDWQIQTTPGALIAVSKYLPRLVSLVLPILPMDLVAFVSQPTILIPRHHTLRSLAIGDVPDAISCASALVQAILAIFPSLIRLDCPAPQVIERFAALTGQAA
ncbi:hypothetical protein BD414DRAFT_434226 [Trametes punicea]|nr:hypothetical protein BD414DRAFT_434226 [Trametes punicea]